MAITKLAISTTKAPAANPRAWARAPIQLDRHELGHHQQAAQCQAASYIKGDMLPRPDRRPRADCQQRYRDQAAQSQPAKRHLSGIADGLRQGHARRHQTKENADHRAANVTLPSPFCASRACGRTR